MIDITIPFWLLLTAAGVPTLSLVLLIVRLPRFKRGQRTQNITPPLAVPQQRIMADFNSQVHHEILEQQIDAVFNALATVLQTERIKLKALVNHPLPTLGAPVRAAMVPAPTPESPLNSSSIISQPAGPAIGQQIDGMSKEGMAASEIAKQLGLSQAEVTLAMKMGAVRKGQAGGKVRAVA